jgi:hypothetical protein
VQLAKNGQISGLEMDSNLTALIWHVYNLARRLGRGDND